MLFCGYHFLLQNCQEEVPLFRFKFIAYEMELNCHRNNIAISKNKLYSLHLASEHYLRSPLNVICSAFVAQLKYLGTIVILTMM